MIRGSHFAKVRFEQGLVGKRQSAKQIPKTREFKGVENKENSLRGLRNIERIFWLGFCFVSNSDSMDYSNDSFFSEFQTLFCNCLTCLILYFTSNSGLLLKTFGLLLQLQRILFFFSPDHIFYYIQYSSLQNGFWCKKDLDLNLGSPVC